MRYSIILSLIFLSILLSACNGETEPVTGMPTAKSGNTSVSNISIKFDEAMSHFDNGDSTQFGIPALFVFNDKGECIAHESYRAIYDLSLFEKVERNIPECSGLELSSLTPGVIPESPTNFDFVYVHLSDDGGRCTSCEEISQVFAENILARLDNRTRYYKVDVGMSDWFAN